MKKKKIKAVGNHPGNPQQMYKTGYRHKNSVDVEVKLDNRTPVFCESSK